MKDNKKKTKRILIIIIMLIICFIITSLVLYFNMDKFIYKNAIINVWKSKDPLDIALYSIGSGNNEMLYTGNKSTHYLVLKNGKVYSYTESSYEYKTTGIVPAPTVTYLGKLTNEQIEIVREELTNFIIYGETTIFNTSWYMEMDGKSNRIDHNNASFIITKHL